MTLRRIAIENSVRYVPKSEQEIKPKTVKTGSLPCKQKKYFAEQ